MKQSHKLQLVEITPDVMMELVGLEKIRVDDTNVLVGNYTEYESALLFNGAPLRFLQQGKKMYLWDRASEVGGLIEYTHLTLLEGVGVKTTDHLATQIGMAVGRRKRFVEICEKACSGVVVNVDLSHAKQFIRKGQPGYVLAQIQATDEKTPEIEAARARIEQAAKKVMGEGGFVNKAAVTTREKRKNKPKAVRIKACKKIEELYRAGEEVAAESELEAMVVVPQAEVEAQAEAEMQETQEMIEETHERMRDEHERMRTTQREKHFEENKNQVIIRHDKSNNEGIERY